MKARSLFGWLFLVMVCGYWWWAQESTPVVERGAAEHKPPLLVLDDAVAYLYDNQGQRSHRIHAISSEYRNDGSGTILTQPTIEQYTTPQLRYISTAQKGFINDTQSTVELHDEVIVRRFEADKLVSHLDTQALRYHVDTAELIADNPIDYRDQYSQIQAEKALWRLRQNSLILNRNIRTHYDSPHSQP